MLFRLLDKRSKRLFTGYLFTAAGVVLLFAILAITFGPHLKQAVVAYVFPENFWLAGEMVFDKLFGKLGSLVLANFILTGGMAAISMTCVIFKELLSRQIETKHALVDTPHKPWPLWRQATEEIKFALMYLLAYDLIFWVAYLPFESTRFAAKALSYLVLFIFFNMTFMCPLFIRHRIGYGRMLRTFFSRPLAAFGFAFLFLAPNLIAAGLLKGQAIGLVTAVLLSIHVFIAAPAAVAGTWISARLLPVARAKHASSKTSKALISVLGLLFLTASGLVFYRLADSINKKSQILKCSYNVDLNSLQFKSSSLLDLSLGLSVELEIENPTPIDLLIENSRIEIFNTGKYFSQVQLAPFHVPAGKRRNVPLELGINVDLARLMDYQELFSKDWKFTLWVEVAEGWEFPVFF
jgi:hypothetical protein